MKKLLTTLLILSLITVLFSACKKEETQEDLYGNSAVSTTLRVGLDDTYKPMEYIDDNGNLVGFDVDFAKLLGEELGMDVEFVSTAWDGIFLALDAKKFDVMISSVSITSERQENYDISTPYLSNGQVIVVPADAADVATIEDLAGLNVGVQIDTTSDNSAKEVNKTVDFELNAYDGIDETFMDLKAGRLNAIVVDSMVALEYNKTNPGLFKITTAKLSNEPIAVYFKKGENSELLEKVNTAIKNLQDSGKLSELSNTWFGIDYTKDIDTKLW